jgi:hypothetical protein
MEILLHDDIAAADNVGLFVADDGYLIYLRWAGILCAINKAEEIALIEVLKALYLIDHNRARWQLLANEPSQLETDAELLRPNVKE